MTNSNRSLVEDFKNDPMIQKLMKEGNLEKVARLATAMGTAGGSPDLRKYGKELWIASQKINNQENGPNPKNSSPGSKVRERV